MPSIELCQDLALQVVKDGEGAEKLIEITVTGAENDKAARKIGMAIANSPLVKTAIAGEDANWGRIVMAVGKSGEKAVRDKLKIWIGGVQLAKNGMRASDYREGRDHAPYEGAFDRHQDRCRRGQGPRHGMDLRSHPSLYRHQRLLSQLMAEGLPMVLVAAVALVDVGRQSAHREAAGRQTDGRPVGISRRQGRVG